MSIAIVLRAYRPDEYEGVLDRIPGLVGEERERRRRRLEASGGRYHSETLFGIEADGRLVGEIQARFDPNMMPPGIYDLGIELWESADRGRGYGRAAIEELLRFLFEDEHAERVQGSTDVDNPAMRATFAAAGFTEEGVLRWFMPSEDGRRDYVQYAITRPDWEARRAGGVTAAPR